MLISICLLGFGAVGKSVYKKLKEVPEFGQTWRVHTVYVPDKSKYPEVKFNKDEQWKINDELFETELETNIGDDLEWLLQSNGHDTIIDTTPYTPASRDLIFSLLKRGYWLHTCSKALVQAEWPELLKTAKNSKAKIYFNSIPSSNTLTPYSELDLTDENWHKFADRPDMYIYRGGGAEETADAIVRDIVKELEKRKAAKIAYESLSDEQKEMIERGEDPWLNIDQT